MAADFKSSSWGDSREKVLANEAKKPLKNQKHYVIFSDILDGHPVFTTYFIDGDNKLKNVSYFFREKKKKLNAYILSFNDFKKYFSRQFGKAEKDELLWHNPKLKGQSKFLGEAVSKGHLELLTQWSHQNNLNVLKLSQYKNKPQITLSFSPKTKAKAMDKLSISQLNLDNNTVLDQEEKLSVMFFELKAIAGFNAEQAKLLENIILVELYNYKKFNVISKEDVQKLFDDEELEKINECKDNTCLLELSGALGVDLLVSGDIGKLGEISQLSLKILNNEDSTVLSRVSKSIEGKSKVLISETKTTVDELLKAYDPSYAPLKLSSSKGLKPEVLVENKQTKSDDPALYETWWFWTGLGVLAAGGAALALSGGDDAAGKSANKAGSNGKIAGEFPLGDK